MKQVLSKVAPERLKTLALDLVNIPSPTNDSREAAEFYAEHLKQLGLEVEVTYEYPHAPNVAAWLKGKAGGEGKTLQFDGHIDAIPVEHSPPCFKDGLIYGRGAADMKGGLTAMAEVARVIIEYGVALNGNLLLTAHGLHEAPIGKGEGLSALIERGVVGDAVINTEGPANKMPVIGRGMCIFEVVISRGGEVIHENAATPDIPHPIIAGNKFVSLIQERAAELAKVDLPYVGPETFFIGSFQSGDFYNRFPTSCQIVGTRRYAPEKTFADVRGEFNEMADEVMAETGAKVEVNLRAVRDGFRLDENEPIVSIVRQSYEEVTGDALPISGWKSVGDVSQFVNEAKVPAVYHGMEGTPHSSSEHVSLDEIVRATKVYLLSGLKYLE